jgi:hypothetical protein
MFVSKNELDQHDLRGNIMKTEDLASKLASMWEVNSGSNIRRVLSEDFFSRTGLLPCFIKMKGVLKLQKLLGPLPSLVCEWQAIKLAQLTT